MCGIAGLIADDLPLEEREMLVWKMVNALSHRGPDGAGVQSLGGATFGVAQLSIVDRGSSQQPLTRAEHDSSQAMLAYNGELYNFLDLRRDLLAAGFNFQTKTDTEVVLSAHLHWGDIAVSSFDGMFAYAVWHPDQRTLLLARDRLGIKPIFFVELPGRFLFASEPKALFATRLLGRSLNPIAILEYFTHGAAFASGYVTGDRTFFSGVHAVPAAHLLKRNPNASCMSAYWSPAQELGSAPCSRAEAPRILEELLRKSTRSMLMGDVPIGTALSGGLDSSIVTAVATQALPGDLVSSCISFESDHSEPDPSHATVLSDWLNGRFAKSHRLLFADIAQIDYLKSLDRLVTAFDEPHWEPRQLGMLANYQTLADARRTVVLAGEGADELFFGYFQKFPGFRSPTLTGPNDLVDHWSRRMPWVEALLAPMLATKASAATPSDLMEAAVSRYLSPYWEASSDRRRAIQCWYLHTFLAWLLMVNDRCSMTHGIEGRFPFLSNDVVSFALKTPPEWNIDVRSTLPDKQLLRDAFQYTLPAAIWRERAKCPLPLPSRVSYHETINKSLREEVHRAPPEIWDLVSRKAVLIMLEDHSRRLNNARNLPQSEVVEALSGYLPLDAPIMVRTQHLFAMLTLLRWHALNFNARGDE